MLSDFPKAKHVIQKAFNRILQQQVKERSPMLSMINQKKLHEGDTLGVLESDGKHRSTKFNLFQSQFTISQEELPKTKTEDIVKKISGAAEDMAGQLERHMFQTMTNIIEESGNTIPGNKEISADAILSALEMISIDFEDDDRSKPIKPSLITSPAAAEKLMIMEAKSTPEEKEEFRKKEEVILDKKYAEHMKDLEQRRLID